MRRYGIALTLTALAAFVAAGHGHVAAATGARLTAITATDGAARTRARAARVGRPLC